MRSLWKSLKAGEPPVEDPLRQINNVDLQDILTKCGADYRPREFGSANVPRLALYMSLLEKGFSADQAAILVGMTFNRVGIPPAD